MAPRATSFAALTGKAISSAAVDAAFGQKGDWSGDTGLVVDAFRLPSDGLDDAPSIQRACDAAAASGTFLVLLLARRYLILSPIVITAAVWLRGQGWEEPNGGLGLATPGRGTWLVVNSPSFTPIGILGGAGTVIERLGVYQIHPAPADGWAPTPYPHVFNVQNSSGIIVFRYLMFLAVDRGILGFIAARLHVEHVYGQFWTNGLFQNYAFDGTLVDDVRNWPHWTQDNRVLSWQQANTDLIRLGRTDDVFIDNLFGLCARSVLKLENVVAWAGNPVYVPGGAPTNVMIGTIRSDFARWTLWNTAATGVFEDVSLSISHLIHQGQSRAAEVPLTDSAAIRNDGIAALISVGYAKCDFLDRAFVSGGGAAPSTVQVGQAMLTFSRSTAGTCYLLDPGSTASTLQFALPPIISAGSNTVVRKPPGATGAFVGWNVPS